MKRRAYFIYTVIFGMTIILLSGCGIFKGEQTIEEMDTPPEEASLTNDLDNASEEGAPDEGTEGEEGSDESEGDEQEGTNESIETVERQLYLLDSNGMVVPQTLELPKAESKEVAKQTLQYLVKGGPVTELLPNGFQAVLPSGTEIIGLNLEEDGTLIVDVSKEFAEYRPEDEQKIVQAMTFTLTQFENVKRVKLWINGYEQDVMPVNGTPISNGYSRANGINLTLSESVDLMDSEAVTLYYPAQTQDQFYYVPVTQHIEMNNDDAYQSIVQALVEGPSYDLNLLNVFNSGTELIEEPTYNDGVLTLSFNENVLNSIDTSSISDEVMETLVLTLTEQPGVDAVNITVENVDEVYNEDGVPYSEPVTRDTFVPTGSL
ncbi:GerMN domain-containing protein [Aquibacillus albus]|uniref:Germination protein M n=1 Tax=Aquibacillus albus TaxID=1168171 RepID=A0ABS2N1K0_9BACI|nr:GerMN domain-containing protein [Aquibacillus albus]MBM7571993.1 germination protein M [Aquibacillus albus]